MRRAEASARAILHVGLGAVVGATVTAVVTPAAGPDWAPLVAAATPAMALMGACIAQHRHRGAYLDPGRLRAARGLVGAALVTAAGAAVAGGPEGTAVGLWAMTSATMTVSVLAADRVDPTGRVEPATGVSPPQQRRLSA